MAGKLGYDTIPRVTVKTPTDNAVEKTKEGAIHK